MVLRTGRELGIVVPMIAAHMFVFYFGIIADITPPVALAAYAGSAIAKSDPIKTGLTASRLAITAFIIPYIFVFNPTMLWVGASPLNVIQIIITSFIGMFGLAAGIEGFMLKKVSLPLRFAAVIGGLMAIDPGYITDIIGFVLIALVFVFQVVGVRREKGAA